MTRHSPVVERQVRIELLRARAAIERESLARSLAETGQAMEPRNLIRGLMPKIGALGKSNASQWVMQAYNVARKYPLVSSAVSSLFMGKGKSSRLLRLVGLGYAGWQAFRGWQSTRPPRHRD